MAAPEVERAALASLFWARRRDGAAISAIAAGLDDAARYAVAALLAGGTLGSPPDEQLLARMLDLAAS